ncbi:MAG TPA: hypothetical protein VE174_02555 [Actinomycetota bacterium]|nr:hypothetical protein [Actinomycetota bacterium]
MTKTWTKVIANSAAVLALAGVFAAPVSAAPAPAGSVVVDVRQVDAGLEIAFTCSAVGVGAATSTEINKCQMQFRPYGWNSDAPAVSSSGPVATTWGHETGLQGGEDHWRVDTWICWEASANFADGASADSSGCSLVNA